MTEIEENNKLIAEFENFDYNSEQFEVIEYDCEFPYERQGTLQDLKYHKSWDWLIPVACKCSNLAQNNMWDEWRLDIDDAMTSYTIKIVYEEVINFLKWYNKHGKE